MCDFQKVIAALCLILFVGKSFGMPIMHRDRRDIPDGFEAPLFLPVKHFGLVDDYGILPKHPLANRRVTRRKPEGLVKVRKSKRDEPDIGEYYYDDIM